MHLETIIFDRIFDIQRRTLWSQFHKDRQTDFSFEANGRTHYAVIILGWPKLEPGHQLTALLLVAHNWQTLVDWKNHSTGEVVLPQVGSALMTAFRCLVMAVITFALYKETTTSAGHFASGGLVAFFYFLRSLVPWNGGDEERLPMQF